MRRVDKRTFILITFILSNNKTKFVSVLDLPNGTILVSFLFSSLRLSTDNSNLWDRF